MFLGRFIPFSARESSGVALEQSLKARVDLLRLLEGLDSLVLVREFLTLDPWLRDTKEPGV